LDGYRGYCRGSIGAITVFDSLISFNVLFSVDLLDGAATSPQARYEDSRPHTYHNSVDSGGPGMLTQAANIVQVNTSQQLTDYIRNFVHQSTGLNPTMPEPKSRWVKNLNDIGGSGGNNIGSESQGEEADQSALTAAKLENISKKLVEYISRQEAQLELKRMRAQLGPANENASSDAPANENVSSNISTVGGATLGVLANENVQSGVLANGNVLDDIAANEALLQSLTSTVQGAGSLIGEGSARLQPAPQVVDVYINGQLQDSDVDGDANLTVSQLSSQYLGQSGYKLTFKTYKNN
jgi:hypothetical protein